MEDVTGFFCCHDMTARREKKGKRREKFSVYKNFSSVFVSIL
jgi:hypothetical protein